MTLTWSVIDLVACTAILLGAWRGWHNGSAWELRRVLFWLLVVAFASLLAMGAQFFAGLLGIEGAWPTILAYTSVLLFLVLTFSHRTWGMERLAETRRGNPGEHWVGAGLGVARYTMIITVLFAYLAMLPPRSNLTAQMRDAVLVESTAGDLTHNYWTRLFEPPRLPDPPAAADTTLALLKTAAPDPPGR